MHDKPLIVQGDLTLLLETEGAGYLAARDAIAPFTELVKSPEYVHTYRISHLSLWNAAATGRSAEEVLSALSEHSRFPVPATVVREVTQYMGRYGTLQLVRDGQDLFLVAKDPLALMEARHVKGAQPWILDQVAPDRCRVDGAFRGHLKLALTLAGLPVEDLAGYTIGDPLSFRLREVSESGKPFALRNYQAEAAEVFHAAGSVKGGAGTIVLPCGAGKTVVAIGAMNLCQCHTLILTTNVVAVRQWMREILDKTTLTPDQVGEYTGETKDIRPVTLATYQILTYRRSKEDTFPHFGLFQARKWGLIVYDEVHLLPAPVFRVSAEVQATRRLGLTATLVREDQKEGDVFALIGPKRYDVPWKTLESQGWIATATCTEIRIPQPVARYVEYAQASDREKIRISSENPGKKAVVEELIEAHPDDSILVIGQYLTQLDELAAELDIPLITGKTPQRERERLFGDFRDGRLRVLMVSKVGNFAIDLPDASVMIQISGTFGSRQEEAQRLGRILRPKEDGRQAHFYSLVTRDTREQDFAMHRQLFLVEQGYQYHVEIRESGKG
ncbi:MAG: DEAD/DEAH box helicase [Fibrobacterota bacterium]|nr:DEAD/DEAH box helicase [Fibrobacterota bacterium]QQS03290.1 MAG: DEAD/DEAH box helicase [Fibrobacterota bacterium]